MTFKVGTGITPTVGQTVVVNYVGWLEDGTQFDSSYDRGETFSFALGMGNVITGWGYGSPLLSKLKNHSERLIQTKNPKIQNKQDTGICVKKSTPSCSYISK